MSTVYLSKTNTPSNKNVNTRRNSTREPCIYCEESHSSNVCSKVNDQKARFEILKQRKACFNCLGNHRVSDCRSKVLCAHCGRKHNTSICSKTQTAAAESTNQEKNGIKSKSPLNQENVSSASAMHCTTSSQVATIQSNSDVSMDANIIFGEGAQRSFITEDLAKQLELKTTESEIISISGFGGETDTVRHLKSTNLRVVTDDESSIQMKVLIVPEITSPI